MSDPDFSVAIVGAGIAGIFIGKRLLDRGTPFTIFEKASEVSGTWREDRYPGLNIDVPTLLYQFPFAPKWDWSRALSPGSEIQDYLVETTYGLGLRDHIRFETELTACYWEAGKWRLSLSTNTEVIADAVIMGTGFLHRPVPPHIPGRADLENPIFHSSQWPDGLVTTKRRVGVVGTESSGDQLKDPGSRDQLATEVLPALRAG